MTGSTDDGEETDGGSTDSSYFERLNVGETHRTRGRTITGADVANFAGVSGDFNELHTDAEAMADSQFGERVAHGALVFSVMTELLTVAVARRARRARGLGVDRLRFAAPVFVGHTIHVELEVAGKEHRDHPEATGLVRYGAAAVDQNGDTVCSCELLALVR
ncbi:monoamine oxidase [Halobacteriales archaeon QH_8_67_27]|nr:MAG: monoamine oxidase [Halobacteriales archaeon QH_8_67_27]